MIFAAPFVVLRVGRFRQVDEPLAENLTQLRSKGRLFE